uniref:FERM, RhoGEF and pleckstrin domain-containing protein 2 n=1 Tax=Ciona savignyi TaxID=51511 RepID=H2Z4V7_CIOSA
MCSYIAQSEFGDWNSYDCSDLSYLNDLALLPPLADLSKQELLGKIAESHKIRTGESKADSDFHLLDIVRRLEQYGLRLLPAKDQENTDIKLAVAHMGVLVFRGNAKINTFNWARIRKLSFKKKRFLIKLRTETSNVGDILVFVMASRDTCKNFWRHCIEYHAFFRLDLHPAPAPKPKIIKPNGTPKPEYMNADDLQINVRLRKPASRSVSNASKNLSFGHPNPAIQSIHDQSRTISLSESEVSIPGMGGGEPRTPSQYAALEQKMIKAGFYSVPTRPPVITDDSETGIMDSDIDKALHELDVATRGLISNGSYEGESDSDESEENYSDNADTRERSFTTTPKNKRNKKLDESILTPITMKFNDHYTGPDYASTDALSSFAIEMEASFDRIRESLSVDKLDQRTNRTPARPLSSSLDVLSMPDDENSFCILPDPVNNNSGFGRNANNNESFGPGYPSSQAYYIAKEILTTERTYVKDLEVITKWFKSALQKESSDFLLPENLANQLFGGIGSLVALHQQFLCTLDDRLSSWEGRGSTGASNDQLVDDLMLNHMLVLKKYLGSLENGESLILALEETGEDSRFESIYREFELQKVCYLPFNSFLLKPMQRVVHYKLVVERLIGYYEDDSSMDNHSDLQTAYQEATALATAIQERLKRAHNLQKLAQLRRDLLGVDNLIKAKRDFIREGSLYKLSRKGFQQRLFFLFSDCLVYTSKGVTSTNQFKVHAELPLQGMIIEVNEGESAVPNCFSILSGTKTVIVAAATQEEMDKWLEDFSVAIALAGRDTTLFDSPLNNTTGLYNSRFYLRLSMEQSSEDGEGSVRNSMERLKPPMQHRSNATMHVCWHRNTSVSSSDHLVSLRNQLSGYLLRKFKNSNGWQKLWVVFTNFCLFFYKSHQDESPLASLPLLGYTINSPSENDGIRKDFVFKLKFKTHVYFFRAESQFTYNRWLEVVSSATVTSQRTRLFSRMDSYQ